MVGTVVVVIVIVGGKAARPLECHSDVRLGFTARYDDGEALFGTDTRTMIAPYHVRGLKLDIGIKARRLLAFIIKGRACEAEVRNVAGGYERGYRRAVAFRLVGGGGGRRCVIRGGP
jgi:hypothetical protein